MSGAEDIVLTPAQRDVLRRMAEDPRLRFKAVGSEDWAALEFRSDLCAMWLAWRDEKTKQWRVTAAGQAALRRKGAPV
ncbi:hypothetical protein JYK14_24500 [Siccirubricoccus sp. KC 17139]|uniref:Uncharacterized protein n=1 Tax=Siccirubricoccus soli TaxID=2899147 RepID=A0ABT1DBI1_9PROT|nr:hypothetical protein [Siccirubricoccus soli]MCO6419296.1 hypothetical protein [Siccirubricoccus soli]MCP2685431.1 hypothetical protein [Siccirubricoccus soli]